MKNEAMITLKSPYGAVLIGCCIDFSSSSGVSGSVIIESTVEVSFINRVDLYGTRECEAVIDIIEGFDSVVPSDPNYKEYKSNKVLICETKSFYLSDNGILSLMEFLKYTVLVSLF